jgi:leucine-rich repeat-containing G protein-coupled receptor 6
LFQVFTVFVLPLNSCFNPFLYAILTKQFKKDCVMICKAIEESRVTRGIGRCRHSSNFSNRQTPANTNSLNSGSGSANHSKNNNSGVHCSCNSKKTNSKMAANKWWPFARLKNLLCGLKEPEDLAAQSKWNNQVYIIDNETFNLILHFTNNPFLSAGT